MVLVLVLVLVLVVVPTLVLVLIRLLSFVVVVGDGVDSQRRDELGVGGDNNDMYRKNQS